MGTRHRQAVITKSGESKIWQYGQWDGYPSGQGVDILEYLREGDLKKYQKNLEVIPLINDDQIDRVNLDSNWTKNYPYLSRDCGSKIHKMIEDGTVQFVKHIDEDEARKWCEGFYTIDFQKGEFISEYYGRKLVCKLDDLPSIDDYLLAMEPKEDDE